MIPCQGQRPKCPGHWAIAWKNLCVVLRVIFKIPRLYNCMQLIVVVVEELITDKTFAKAKMNAFTAFQLYLLDLSQPFEVREERTIWKSSETII